MIWRDFTDDSAVMGLMPLFSASAMGISSKASAKACMAYCSMPDTLSAASATAREHEISADPPPYTMRLSLMRLRVTHMASCRERLVSSMSMWLPPRTNTVTARELLHSSMTSMRSMSLPKLLWFRSASSDSLLRSRASMMASTSGDASSWYQKMMSSSGAPAAMARMASACSRPSAGGKRLWR